MSEIEKSIARLNELATLLEGMSSDNPDSEHMWRVLAELARVTAERDRLKECEDRVGELLKSLREMETCRDEAKSMLEFLSTGVDWKRSGLDQYAIDLIPVAIQRSKTMEEREASQATGGGER